MQQPQLEQSFPKEKTTKKLTRIVLFYRIETTL